jgi:hypothetical protein
MSTTHADPSTLDREASKLALHCVETIERFRAYTGSALLVMLLDKFRDDIREAHFKDPLLPTPRGGQRLQLDELTSSELETVTEAVGTLLGKFASFMDDPELPELLRDFQDALKVQNTERADIRADGSRSASAGTSPRASNC